MSYPFDMALCAFRTFAYLIVLGEEKMAYRIILAIALTVWIMVHVIAYDLQYMTERREI